MELLAAIASEAQALALGIQTIGNLVEQCSEWVIGVLLFLGGVLLQSLLGKMIERPLVRELKWVADHYDEVRVQNLQLQFSLHLAEREADAERGRAEREVRAVHEALERARRRAADARAQADTEIHALRDALEAARRDAVAMRLRAERAQAEARAARQALDTVRREAEAKQARARQEIQAQQKALAALRRNMAGAAASAKVVPIKPGAGTARP
jgi:chromosome segregation ATPase